MLKKILISLAGGVAVLLIVIVTRADEYKVVRTARVEAPPATVVAQIADFHRWEAWSPWAKLDAAMQTDYAGTPGAEGSTYHWKGEKTGEGRMTISRLPDPGTVVIKLEFMKPFESVATTTFSAQPDGAGSTVSWTMEGKNNFMGKAMSLGGGMDKMIGPDFEKGLAQLKAVAEAAPKAN